MGAGGRRPRDGAPPAELVHLIQRARRWDPTPEGRRGSAPELDTGPSV